MNRSGGRLYAAKVAEGKRRYCGGHSAAQINESAKVRFKSASEVAVVTAVAEPWRVAMAPPKQQVAHQRQVADVSQWPVEGGKTPATCRVGRTQGRARLSAVRSTNGAKERPKMCAPQARWVSLSQDSVALAHEARGEAVR